MAFCLPTNLVKEFIERLKSGEIEPGKLTEMTSAERRTFFSEFLGEQNAKQVNALFESKLLLKNQQTGMINWAKKTAGMKPEIRRDILARVERMTEVLQPKEIEAFLEDLVSQRLGINITLEEANKIAGLAKLISEKKSKVKEDFTFETEEQRMEYGRARIAFDNYMSDLKTGAERLELKDLYRSPGKFLTEVAGTAKSMKATLDNSAIFRQGWKSLWTNPGIWLKNAKQTFVDIVKTLGGRKVMDEINADIVSRPNSINGYYKKANLAVGTVEEPYPSHLPAKIPFVRRVYTASETAFTGFVYKQRVDIFDKYIEIAKKSGIDVSSQEFLVGNGRVINALTGRGALGRLEPVANVVNNVFFSPRFAKSQFDVLTAHIFDPKVSGFARKQAAVNLVKIIGGTAAVLVVANAVRPGSVDWDSRSADFGKIRVRDTRYDVTGGMASLVVLASRLATMSSKSSTTGKITELGTGEFGAMTGLDVVYNFFENKLSPAAVVVKDLLDQRDFQGDKPTVAGETVNLFVPIIIENYFELKNNPQSANILLSMIADALGIGTNTYSITTNWNQSTSAEIQAFKEKVGQKQFEEANKKFNEQFTDWFSKTSNNPRYTGLDADRQQTLISNKKKEIRDKIFSQYHFYYRAPTKKPLPKL